MDDLLAQGSVSRHAVHTGQARGQGALLVFLYRHGEGCCSGMVKSPFARCSELGDNDGDSSCPSRIDQLFSPRVSVCAAIVPLCKAAVNLLLFSGSRGNIKDVYHRMNLPELLPITWQQLNAFRHVDLLKIKLRIRLGKKLQFYWDFHTQPSPGFTENDRKKGKHPMSVSSLPC